MKPRFFFLLGVLCVLFSFSLRAEKRSVVRLETNHGVIRVALFDETPIHRDNFLRLAESAFYDSTVFHRVIADFMIQGGDAASRLGGGARLDADSAYTLPAEIVLPYLYHHRGALAAAREPDEVNPERRSSGTQFYIVWGKRFTEGALNKVRASLWEQSEGVIDLSPESFRDYVQRGGSPHLDGAYTVFGEVVEGFKVVKKIQKLPTDSLDRPLRPVVLLRAVVEQRSRAALQQSGQAR